MEAVEGASTSYVDNPWYIYECLPFIKDIEGFPEAGESGPKHNKALVQFIRHANTLPIQMVRDFVTNKKEEDCEDDGKVDNKGQGFVSKCYTGKQCCPTPWLTECDNEEVCYTDYFTCDGGRCIPRSWVNDDWPDCFDGSDETAAVAGAADTTLPQQLVCIQCAGVVLSAGFVCRESPAGLTNDCVQETMGSGGACNQCVSMYLNLTP